MVWNRLRIWRSLWLLRIWVYCNGYELMMNGKCWLKAKSGDIMIMDWWLISEILFEGEWRDLGLVVELIKRIIWDWTMIWWFGYNRLIMKYWLSGIIYWHLRFCYGLRSANTRIIGKLRIIGQEWFWGLLLEFNSYIGYW